MKILLLLPLLLGFSVPAIAHNEVNGGCGNHCGYGQDPGAMGSDGEITPWKPIEGEECPPNDLGAC